MTPGGARHPAGPAFLLDSFPVRYARLAVSVVSRANVSRDMPLSSALAMNCGHRNAAVRSTLVCTGQPRSEPAQQRRAVSHPLVCAADCLLACIRQV
jgi:hypothetical protein